jgi:hypothetical protein
MSKPMILSKPASRETSTAPTMPRPVPTDRVLALEPMGIGQTAARLHELQPWRALRLAFERGAGTFVSRRVGTGAPPSGLDLLHMAQDR